MAHPSPAPQIPSSFFEGVDRVPARTTITSDLRPPQRPNSHSPSKAMYWYDAIIDDMFANPGTTHKATAARLGRSAVTIGYIVNSDLFKARYSQRRDQFNEDLDTRLIGKLAKVAELSLDLTMESLEKKRTAVPLPLLHEVADKALNRLGYGPKQQAPGAAVAVTVNNANGPQQIVAPVSAEALAAARSTLRTIEQSRAEGAARLSLEEGRVATARPLARPIEQSLRPLEGSSAPSTRGEADDEERGGGGGLGAL